MRKRRLRLFGAWKLLLRVVSGNLENLIERLH